MLGDSETCVRREATDSLVDLKANDEGAFIAKLLSDDNDKVRKDAVRALGKLNSPEGTEALIGALHDDDGGVRKGAIKTIGRTGAQDALPALKDMYESGQEKNPFRVAKAIRKLGDSDPFDREVARLAGMALNSDDEKARYKAIRALGNNARDDAQEIFRHAMGDASKRVRKEAKKALRDRK